MTNYDTTRLIITIVFILILFVILFRHVYTKKVEITTKFITKTAIFAALSIVLYIIPYLKFSVPFFPAFLEIHFDEVPIFIAGFAYGPLSAFIIIVIKTLIKLPLSTSMCVGELADLLYSICFVIPAAVIYNKKRCIKNAVIGLGVGTLCQVVVASFFTSFVILNFYMAVIGLSEETIIAMCKAINPSVTSLGFTFLLYVALPFNLFKDALVLILTIILYKKLHTIIDKASTKKLGN